MTTPVEPRIVGAWSATEDQLLKDAVRSHGRKWSIISREVFRGTRAQVQCSKRYDKLATLAKPESNESFGKAKKVDPWSPEENQIYYKALQNVGENYAQISFQLSLKGHTRSAQQCRRHRPYFNKQWNLVYNRIIPNPNADTNNTAPQTVSYNQQLINFVNAEIRRLNAPTPLDLEEPSSQNPAST